MLGARRRWSTDTTVVLMSTDPWSTNGLASCIAAVSPVHGLSVSILGVSIGIVAGTALM